MLHAKGEKTETTTNNVHVLIFLPSPFANTFFFSSYSFLFSILFTFLSVSIAWHADAHCRSYGVQILLSFIFPLSSFVSFILRYNWHSYCISGGIVDNCSTGIRTVYAKVKGEVVNPSIRQSVKLDIYPDIRRCFPSADCSGIISKIRNPLRIAILGREHTCEWRFWGAIRGLCFFVYHSVGRYFRLYTQLTFDTGRTDTKQKQKWEDERGITHPTATNLLLSERPKNIPRLILLDAPPVSGSKRTSIKQRPT